MNSSRLGRYVSWIVVIVILAAGWAALRMTERQLLRLRAAREAGRPAAPTATLRSVGPFASESGPVGRPVAETGPSGATGAHDEAGTPISETDGRKAPSGAVW